MLIVGCLVSGILFMTVYAYFLRQDKHQNVEELCQQFLLIHLRILFLESCNKTFDCCIVAVGCVSQQLTVNFYLLAHDYHIHSLLLSDSSWLFVQKITRF
jgi:hypothetical protein